MIWASASCNPEVAQILIDRGSDVNVRDKEGKTALAYALNSKYRKTPEIVKILKENGAVE